jgi:hypothetical protein
MSNMKYTLLACCLLLTTALAAQAPTKSEISTVQASATVSGSPARITLNWPAWATATGYTIQRKLRSATSWGGTLGTATGTATSYIDNTVALNTVYEYRITRTAPEGTGTGYVCSGIEVQPVDYMGKVVLLVDNMLAAGLTTELAQLQEDLKRDGWVVVRHDVSPSATSSSVRTLVQGTYNADPANVKAVYCIGHVPVPYSGNIAPDGHIEQHKGAWPCDAYYGEMNSTWSDAITGNVDAWPDNRNNPGDGKWDHDSPPSAVELQVGRVDLHDMPYFSQTHTQLLSSYLTRAHNFKIKAWTPQTRGIIYDDLQGETTPIAGSGWRNIAPLVGAANITEVTPTPSAMMQDLVNGQSYLWTFGAGGGTVGNDAGVLMFFHLVSNAYTIDLATTKLWGGVFNMQYGSWVGDWNNRNNLMRAVIARGDGLTNVYSAVPNFFLHTMGMGETIGQGVLMSVNNTTLYTPQSGGTVQPDVRSAMSLLGDPTLRMMMTPPPTGLSVSNSGGNAAFSWSAAPGAGGYHVYRFNANGVPVRLNSTLITGTGWTSTQAFAAGDQYMVRAAKLETTASGSYWNLSLGALATATNTGVQVAPQMLLEGAWDAAAGLMRDDLRAAGLIPPTEPYSALGFAQVAGGGGETVAQAVLNATGNNAIVDWVRVELRSSTNPSTVLATQQGLLQRDGDVVATNGTSPLTFNVGAGNYHVSVRHRNHLGVMTASAVALGATSTTVNFRGTTLATYGTEAQKTIGTVRTLWAGNTTGDGVLKYTGSGNDRDPILTRVGSSTPNGVAAGYWPEDVTLNGQVRYAGAGNDRDPILVNVGSTTPNGVRVQQLP